MIQLILYSAFFKKLNMSAQSDNNDDEVIYDLVLNAYNKLPPKGKPKAKEEWTHLAAVTLEIINHDAAVEYRDVIAIGTGTKCVGRSKLVANGTVVRDSHAEIIARRCFLVYLYDCLSAFYCSKIKEPWQDIFEYVTVDGKPSAKCRIKSNIRFGFFLTHPPCGDAAIFDKTSVDEKEDDEIGIDVRESNNLAPPPPKKSRIAKGESEGDIYRTGAKCVPSSSLQDPLLPLSRYHVLGVLRSKPGRGDPTLSMSCSDKLLKWHLLGLQGALLSHFIAEPIRFCRVVFSKCPISPSAINRALSVTRLPTVADNKVEQPNLPQIVVLKRQFDFCREVIVESTARYCSKARPAATSICYCKNMENRDTSTLFNVLVDGFKQGVTKKHLGTAKAASFICSYELFRKFVNLCESLPTNVRSELCLTEHSTKSYTFAKTSSTAYSDLRNFYMYNILKGWLFKPPELSEFKMTQSNM